MELPPFITAETQIQKLKTPGSRAEIVDLLNTQFSVGDGYLLDLDELLAENDQYPQDAADLVKILCYQAAQFGYDFMGGHLDRSQKKGDPVKRVWQREPFHSFHLLATISHIAKLNSSVYPYKSRWYNQLLQTPDFKSYAYGVWGVPFKFKKGQIALPRKDELGSVRELTLRKLRGEDGDYRPNPICMATIELNDRLAGLDFDRDTADSVSELKFMQEVFPKAASILSPFLNPFRVFPAIDRSK